MEHLRTNAHRFSQLTKNLVDIGFDQLIRNLSKIFGNKSVFILNYICNWILLSNGQNLRMHHGLSSGVLWSFKNRKSILVSLSKTIVNSVNAVFLLVCWQKSIVDYVSQFKRFHFVQRLLTAAYLRLINICNRKLIIFTCWLMIILRFTKKCRLTFYGRCSVKFCFARSWQLNDWTNRWLPWKIGPS